MNILHVCANPKPTEESVCKRLALEFFSTLVQQNPDIEINNIDLYQTPPPFVTYEQYRAAWNPVFNREYQPTKEERASLKYAQEQAAMFNRADLLVLTMPMWNSSFPAIMKAWIDQILMPDLTFIIEPDGPKALHNVTKIIMLVSSGGVYKEEDPRDALTAEIRAAFGYIGITDIKIAWADGQNPGHHSDFELRQELAIEAAQELAAEIAESV